MIRSNPSRSASRAPNVVSVTDVAAARHKAQEAIANFVLISMAFAQRNPVVCNGQSASAYAINDLRTTLRQTAVYELNHLGDTAKAILSLADNLPSR